MFLNTGDKDGFEIVWSMAGAVFCPIIGLNGDRLIFDTRAVSRLCFAS